MAAAQQKNIEKILTSEIPQKNAVNALLCVRESQSRTMINRMSRAAKKTAPDASKKEEVPDAVCAVFCLRVICDILIKKSSKQAVRLPVTIAAAPFTAPNDAADIPVKIPETEAAAQNQISPAKNKNVLFFPFNVISPLQDRNL